MAKPQSCGDTADEGSSTFRPNFDDPERGDNGRGGEGGVGGEGQSEEDGFRDDFVSRSLYRIKISQANGPVNLSSGGNLSVLTQEGSNFDLSKASNVVIHVNNFINGSNLHMDSEATAEVTKDNLGMVLSLLGSIPGIGGRREGQQFFAVNEEEQLGDDQEKTVEGKRSRVIKRSGSLPDLSRSRLKLGIHAKNSWSQQQQQQQDLRRKRSSRRKKTEVKIQTDSSSSSDIIAEVEVTTSITRGSPKDFHRSKSQTEPMRGGQALKQYLSNKAYINPIRFFITTVSLIISVVLMYFLVMWLSSESFSSPSGLDFQ